MATMNEYEQGVRAGEFLLTDAVVKFCRKNPDATARQVHDHLRDLVNQASPESRLSQKLTDSKLVA